MRRVLILQARTGSSRLPGKILLDLAGRPMLAQQLRRLRRCRTLDEIVVATSDLKRDDLVVALARAEGVRWYRGDEGDVLGRFLGAAREARADLVVRSTADCPLIDPEVADRVVEALAPGAGAGTGAERWDYAANVLRRTYPRGLDTEALFRDVLERLARLARAPGDREHVTLYLRATRPDLFLAHSVEDAEDNSDLRWTVDTEADLAFARAAYESCGLAEEVAPYRRILAWVRSHPSLALPDLESHGYAHPAR
ncbi:MAG: cytidylyltransferase domain-containing protein [Planctomycetaceae bacterium]